MSRSGLDGWSACRREAGHGPRRFLAETKLAEGALLVDDGRRKELTVEWHGMRRSSPTKVDQVRLKSGSGTGQSTLMLRAFLLTSNVNPPNGECAKSPLQN